MAGIAGFLAAVAAFIANAALIMKGIISLITTYQSARDAREKEAAELARQEREKAAEAMKNAQTEEEIWNAQDGVVSNKPK